MKSIDSIIAQINDKIKESIHGTNVIHGLCRVTSKGSERVIYDHKNEVVIFDDKFDNYCYHLISGSRSFEQTQQRGKDKIYNITPTVELICFSKNRNFDEHVITSMSTSKVVTLDIIEIDDNALALFKREVGDIDKYDLNRYIFSIKYKFSFSSSLCQENNCPDCI